MVEMGACAFRLSTVRYLISKINVMSQKSNSFTTMECCADPLDYDIDIMSILFDDIDPILEALGICALCSTTFKARRCSHRCEWCYPYGSPDECTMTKSCLMLARFLEAQMKERMTCISKDMARPSYVGINDRIVSLVQLARR